jgi:hypothetical protein
VPRITDFFICIYVLGCKLSLFRLCDSDSDFGIIHVDDVTIAITCAVFRFHIAHISFALLLFIRIIIIIVVFIIILYSCLFRTRYCSVVIKRQLRILEPLRMHSVYQTSVVVRRYVGVGHHHHYYHHSLTSWCSTSFCLQARAFQCIHKWLTRHKIFVLFQKFVSFCVLFLCKCVLYYCHRVATQLQLTNIANIKFVF